MNRPWQIWTLYALCVAIATPAMCWLTVHALNLDAAEAESRRQLEAARRQADAARQAAEREERVNSALWRMDTAVTPLLAREAARPAAFYEPFVDIGDGSPNWPSPLLGHAPDFVVLHFQIAADGVAQSPQVPQGPQFASAVAAGVPETQLREAARRWEQLRPHIRRDDLLAILPKQALPSLEYSAMPWAANSVWNYNVSPLGSTSFDVVQTEEPLPSSQAPQPEPTQVADDASPQGPAPVVPPEAAPGNRSQAGTRRNARMKVVQNFAQQAVIQQRAANEAYSNTFETPAEPSQRVTFTEGASRPLWLGERLILARRVVEGPNAGIQGAWLDWPRLKASLLSEVADLLPQADLVAVQGEIDGSDGRLLATLPVRLIVPEETDATTAGSVPRAADGKSASAITFSLVVAWGGLIFSAGAAAALLMGVISLSERRAAFVAAVTHELRSPLTTFRMYTEMLTEGMVPDPEQQHTYLVTLRNEGDRLHHLVENVLSYARLERGNVEARKRRVPVPELLDRGLDRLRDRASAAGLELELATDEQLADREFLTDPGAIEQILFNLVDNAAKYAAQAADRCLSLAISADPDSTEQAIICLRDHGPGVPPDLRGRLFEPFSKSAVEAAHTAPGVGLGLALSRRLATELGGQLWLDGDCPDGACFCLALPLAPS